MQTTLHYVSLSSSNSSSKCATVESDNDRVLFRTSESLSTHSSSISGSVHNLKPSTIYESVSDIKFYERKNTYV